MHIVFFSRTYFYILMAAFLLKEIVGCDVNCCETGLMGGLDRFKEKEPLRFKFSMNYLEVNVFR